MTLETGIAIVGDPEVQAIAVPLMQRYSPHLLTVFPASITVVYPFVAIDDLEAACKLLRSVGTEIAPFEITLQGYGQFPRVTFMEPLDPAPIRVVHRRIVMEFKDHPSFRGGFRAGIHPHMTVAMFEDEASQQQADFPDYGSISFLVERLHVVYGPGTLDMPFLTYDVIPLLGS